MRMKKVRNMKREVYERVEAGDYIDVEIGPPAGSRREATVVLLGDSTIDNVSYVLEGQDTVSQVRKLITDRKVVSFARDGARVGSIEGQLVEQKRAGIRLPHTVLSVGGNDIVGIAARFHDKSQSSFGQAMRDIHRYKTEFELEYNALAYELASRSSALTLCTVYKPNFTSFTDNALATTLLPVFNQVIEDAAERYSATLIDLYTLIKPDWITCNIEPNGLASLVFAHAIQRRTNNTVELAA